MGVVAGQHIALRVRDVERAADFYRTALGARLLTLPFLVEGPEIEELFGGHAGLEAKVCLLAFDQGAALELFEFVHPSEPATAIDPPSGNIIHWCLQTDDVEGALAQVLAAGGTSVAPLGDWGGSKFVFCADLDGNVFELADSSVEATVARTLALFPEATPPI